MDEETRNIELMKIAATLTLARCVLAASPEHIHPDVEEIYIRQDFIKDMDRLEQLLIERLATRQDT